MKNKTPKEGASLAVIEFLFKAQIRQNQLGLGRGVDRFGGASPRNRPPVLHELSMFPDNIYPSLFDRLSGQVCQDVENPNSRGTVEN